MTARPARGARRMRLVPGLPPHTSIQGAPSAEEAAAVIAAIEQFLAETAPAPAPAGPSESPWVRAGRLEAVGRPLDDTDLW